MILGRITGSVVSTIHHPIVDGRKLLLAETSLPLEEVVELTGLNIYDIVGLKLKMRSAA